jgi:ABC-type amino acid transport substrate-binding protein
VNILADEKLRFMTQNIAPWAYMSSQSPTILAGIFPALIDELSKRTGIAMTIRLATHPRVYRELYAKRQDCTILADMDAKTDRPDLVKGELVSYSPFGVVTKKNSQPKNPPNTRDIKINLLKEYKIELSKMGDGKIDEVTGSIPSILFYAKNKSMTHLLKEPVIVDWKPIYFMCSKNSPSLIHMEKINHAIRQMKKDTTLAKILEEHNWPLIHGEMTKS